MPALSHRVDVLGVLAVAAAMLGPACFRAHVPPAPGAPTASIKVRSVHPYAPTRQLAHEILVDGRLVEEPEEARGAGTTWTRVAPGRRTFELVSTYSRQVMVTQPVLAPTLQSIGMVVYPGVTIQPQHVDQTQGVAGCRRVGELRVREDVVYLLTFAYLGPRRCLLLCHEQRFNAPGKFLLEPCQGFRLRR
jgi:hypothetical protein